MNLFFKIFGIFLAFWLVWYLTGGPRRSANIKPYVKYDSETNTVRKSNEELSGGLGGQLVDPVQNLNNINNQVQNLGN